MKQDFEGGVMMSKKVQHSKIFEILPKICNACFEEAPVTLHMERDLHTD